MFRKDFKVKSNVLTKNSEKKHVLENISKFFRIDISKLTNIFNKSKLSKIKIDCHNDVQSTIYQFDSRPLFFEVNGILVPTIYLLWLYPDFVFSFKIHEETIRYLINGSDLMIPGIIVEKPLHEKSYGIFTKNELVSINTNKNQAPIAIGMTNHDNYDMFMCGGRGKAVNVLHVQGDYLWAFGDKSLPPQIDWEIEVSNEDSDEEITNLETETEKIILSEPDVCNEEVGIDQMLLDCFLHAIKCSIKDRDLPMILNVFYANHVLRFCPENFTMDVKKTSYKKFSAFIEAMVKDGLITIMNQGPGIQAIKSINRSHSKLYFQPKLVYRDIKTETESNSEREYIFPKIEDILFITDKSCNLLRFEGFKKSDTIKPTELREIITRYVKTNQLVSAENELVQLNDVLRSCCMNPNENISQLSWKTLFDRFNKNMTPGIRMTFGNETICIRNMKTPKIRMEATFKNNKMITRIEGAEVFRIDTKQFCSKIQQLIGCSCGTVANKSGVVAIQAQGDQRKRILQILFEVYKVPKTYVEVAEKSK